MQTDRAHMRMTDWRGRKAGWTVHLPPGSPLSMVTSLATLTEATMTAALTHVTHEVTEAGPDETWGQDADFGAHTQRMRLNFLDAIEHPYTVYVYGPAAVCFLGDGVTVDEGQADVADLIAFLLANGVSEDNEALLSYVDGERETAVSAPVDILGASEYFSNAVWYARFAPRHGAGVKT